MTLYARLREQLAQGFFPDNYEKVARLALESSWQTDNPLGLYVLASVLESLSRDWGDDEQGSPMSLTEAMTATMEPPALAYLDAASTRDLTADEEALYLNDLIRALQRWRAR